MSGNQEEYIGKVRLDYSCWPGEDLYSDGEIEDRLLEIAQSVPESGLNAVIAEDKSWPVLYHMSHIRENILDGVPISADDEVLEIGSGCGAVTGSLARRAKHVTCIDLSKKRSQINAWRHARRDNLEILVGNFSEIAGKLDRKYDVVTLIGVFEYGAAFMGDEDPYGSFLRLIRGLLREDGRLVIAIENRLGLKYWAGAREDHTGGFFEGLEDYPEEPGVRTFSRTELKEILEKNGYPSLSFSYPYPDYKLPVSIFSDRFLPREGELNTNIWNFDRDRLVLFDETKVFDSLIRSGLFPDFSNSFLVIAKKQADGKEAEEMPVYVKYSNDRSRKYSVCTQITEDSAGGREVRKTASWPEGQDHIDRMGRHYAALADLFADTDLRVNRTRMEGDTLILEYLDGTHTLADEAGDKWRAGDHKGARAQLRSLCAIITGKAKEAFTVTQDFTDFFHMEEFPYEDHTLPVTDLDMIADNVLIGRDGSWTLIDCEWTVDYPVPVRFVTFRVWHYFHAFFVKDVDEKTFLEDAGYSWPEALVYLKMEEAWQDAVVGENHPLRTLHAKITPGSSTPREVRHGERNSAEPEGMAFFGLARPGSTLEEAGNGGAGAGSSEEAGDGGAGAGKAEDAGDREENARAAESGSGGDADETSGPSRVPSKEKVVRGIRMKMTESHFEVVLSTKGIGPVTYIRWDPLSEQLCRIKIESVTAPALLKVTALNGFQRDGWDEFWSLDPAYLIEGDLPGDSEVIVRGELQTIPFALKLPQMDSERAGLIAQNAAQTGRADGLQEELNALKATKAFRVTEKMRRARNYIMARVRTIPPFRIKADPDETPKGDPVYQDWFEKHSAGERQLEMQRSFSLTRSPKISILVPTWNTPEQYLREMIDSVRNQTFANWELCIADASVEGEPGPDGKKKRNEKVRAILEEYAAADPRIKVVFLEDNKGISENTNAAWPLATGDYISLLDHDDLLAPDALFEVASAICVNDPDVIYTDEDRIDMSGSFHFDPNLKPDFAPDLLRSHNYITHFLVLRRELLERIGLLRSEFDGAQDYDLVLRATENGEKIVHIPKLLYYWRTHPGSTAQNPEGKLYAYDAGARAIAAQLERKGIPGKVENMKYWGLNHVRYETPGDPLVSVIIPNKDHRDDLKLCVESMMERSSYRNFEIVIVENNSTEEETFAYYKELEAKYSQVRVVTWEREFNYSAINNFGAANARGDYLLLLNNDTELLESDSLGEMLGLCMQKEIGCVGAKLLFADDTVQHCGIILGPGGFAGHVFSGIKDTDYGFKMRAIMTGNWSAVTAACLMVRREVFDEVGGLTEDFAVALNDIDFCMKVRAAGYRIVCTPFAKWHHFESKSRGYEDTPEKKERFEREVLRFRARWGAVVDAGDPYYNPNLSVDRMPFTLW